MRTWLYISITGLLLLTGCGGMPVGPEQAIPKPGQSTVSSFGGTVDEPAHTSEQADQLTIWSYYDLDEWTREQITNMLPDVHVSYHIVPTLQAVELYKKALTSDEVPDIFLLEAPMLGSFNDSQAFEDLAAAPYNAETLLERYSDAITMPYRRFDGTGLVALPIDTNPIVTYYRQDVMQDAGFPTDPEELAVYMEKPDQWLDIARTLKQRDQWIASWGSYPLLIYQHTASFFDSQLHYLRNNEQVIQAIQLGRILEAEQLALTRSMFDTKQNPIPSGEMVMFQTGYWFRHTLEELAPEQSGNWRITRLPFNAYGWSGSSGVAIAAESKNKAAAWKVAQWLADNHSRYMSELMLPSNSEAASEPNGYFGGQKLEPLIRTLIRQMPTFTPSPLDEKASIIWWQAWTEEKDNVSLTAEEVAGIMEQRVLEGLAPEIQVLQERQTVKRPAE